MAKAQMTPGVPVPVDSSPPPRLWLDWVIVFVVALVLYVSTCAPDVLPGDSGAFQLRVAEFPPTPARYMTDSLVGVHPLYLAVGKAFTWLPIGNIAHRVNLASACLGAIALANIFALVRLLSGSRWAAALGVLATGLGHSFWTYAVIAECLMLVAAFLTTELLFLGLFARTGRKRWFFLAALSNGLSFSNHMMGALNTPIYVVLALVWRRRRQLRNLDLLAVVGLWLLGASFYLYIVLRAMVETGDVLRIVRSATTGGWPAANVTITAALALKVAQWFVLQYPTLLILLGIYGIRFRPVQKQERRFIGAVIAVAAIQFAFAARYPVPDQYSFFVPCYAALGVMIGLGSWKLIRRWPWTRWAGLTLAVLPIAAYMVLPSLAKRAEPQLFRAILSEELTSYWDPYPYFFRPWQCGNHDMRRYAGEVLRSVPKGAVLVADFMPATAMLYLHFVEKQRPDIQLAMAFEPFPLESLLRASKQPPSPEWVRPVYTLSNRVPFVPDVLGRGFRLVREGLVYRVDPPGR